LVPSRIGTILGYQQRSVNCSTNVYQQKNQWLDKTP